MLDEANAPGVPRLFFVAFDSTEGEERRATRFVRCHAQPFVPLLLELDVQLELVGQLAFDMSAARQRSQPPGDAMHEHHVRIRLVVRS